MGCVSSVRNPFGASWRNVGTSRFRLSKEEENNSGNFFEGEHLNRQLGGYGYPMMFIVTYDKPSWQPFWEN
ncbi:conserved Plasmodium protein, unknown function [Plasmodium ovale wallikeri]|nr:conserved Plasmodium protein, unknown function [Plasmodium ovale wallikeri]